MFIALIDFALIADGLHLYFQIRIDNMKELRVRGE